MGLEFSSALLNDFNKTQPTYKAILNMVPKDSAIRSFQHTELISDQPA